MNKDIHNNAPMQVVIDTINRRTGCHDAHTPHAKHTTPDVHSGNAGTPDAHSIDATRTSGYPVKVKGKIGGCIAVDREMGYGQLLYNSTIYITMYRIRPLL